MSSRSSEAEARTKAEALFSIIPALPFGQEQAAAYCSISFKRNRFDRLIAAHALSLGLTLVTANEAGFSDVPGLKIENWAV